MSDLPIFKKKDYCDVFCMQRVWAHTNTRYFKRLRTLLRESRQAKMSNVSTIPGYTFVYRWRYGSICNACVKKSNQREGATAYKALRNTIEERWWPEFRILHTLQRWSNPTNSPGRNRHTQVSLILFTHWISNYFKVEKACF